MWRSRALFSAALSCASLWSREVMLAPVRGVVGQPKIALESTNGSPDGYVLVVSP